MCVYVQVCVYCVHVCVPCRANGNQQELLFLTMWVPRLNSDCHVSPSAFPLEATSPCKHVRDMLQSYSYEDNRMF